MTEVIGLASGYCTFTFSVKTVKEALLPIYQNQSIEAFYGAQSFQIFAPIRALLFSSGSADSDVEDSFVHNFIANLFENVFRSDGSLESCCTMKFPKLTQTYQYKSDYVLFVTHRLDLACAEVKSLTGNHTFPKSDLVKIGQEMRWMINKLVREGVNKPMVGGVQISGFKMYTYKMDIISTAAYRLVELGNSQRYLLKNVNLTTAREAKERLRQKSQNVPSNPNLPLSRLRDNDFSLIKNQKKECCNVRLFIF
ncbi:hypothetical protein BDB00DRAFT_787231 [Zychaea mexicana]|uniref:uncharacterized protein n=1 Tax=Zychaea mexicana TaxID=64656 RepID=UPI0022FDE555|nr:uncharacterized protein BDB00DRAFT_787231 [Zychaea mexicana]KAI9494394.1 hypothetical protein BDB00DRAFT_787231 [Zychaea mexicana]